MREVETLTLTEGRTTEYESDGPEGDRARRVVHAEARALAVTDMDAKCQEQGRCEIRAAEGYVLDYVTVDAGGTVLS